jgi:hypothetical protein
VALGVGSAGVGAEAADADGAGAVGAIWAEARPTAGAGVASTR